MSTKFYYSIERDFPNNKVNAVTLENEIRSSQIGSALVGITVNPGAYNGEDVLVEFKRDLTGSDVLILDNATRPASGLIGQHQGEAPPETPDEVEINAKKTVDGRIRVAVEKGVGERRTFISHRWNDKTTWLEKSVKVENEIATNSGDNQTYNLASTHIIDVYHGKITDEDFATQWSVGWPNGGSFRVSVEVDSGGGFEVKTENFPDALNGDFEVDYQNGNIIFNNPLNPSDIVRSTYWRAGTTPGCSMVVIKPNPGKKLSLELVEVQFSTDTVLKDTVVFDTYGFIGAFAPQFADDENPNYVTTFPSQTMIPLVFPKIYKTMHDYVNESNKAYPKYPVMGGPGWRGIQNETIVFNWDYVRGIVLESSKGMEIRIYLMQDIPFEGEYATVSIYAVEESED